MQGICATAIEVGEAERGLMVPRFAIPFEEDERDPKTFFLDLDYVEEMWRMFRKVNGMSSPVLRAIQPFAVLPQNLKDRETDPQVSPRTDISGTNKRDDD